MNNGNTQHDRLTELLADRAVAPLSAEEQAELDQLLAQVPGGAAQGAEFELVAGRLAGAMHTAQPGATLPAALRGRLLAQGAAMVALNAKGGPTVEAKSGATGRAVRTAYAGWLTAAAAIAIAAAGWLRPMQSATPETTPTWVQRSRLLQEHADTVTIALNATPDPLSKQLAGDVVWNQRLQKGFLRFKGLPGNDPKQAQYQCWIFDAGRQAEYPVDGGVFDAQLAAVNASTGDLIIPIDPKLVVRDPAAFAVTVEQAGGVVVTKRDRVLALAAKPAPAVAPEQTPKP